MVEIILILQIAQVYLKSYQVKIHLEISGKDEKSPLGPIIGPNPGPTFEIDVAAPEIAVIKSRPVKDSNAARIKKITK